MLCKNWLDEHLKTGSRWSGDHTLAFQVSDTLDSTVSASNEEGNIGSHRGNSANIVLLVPSTFTARCKIRDCRIRECQFKIPLLKTPDILLRPLGTLGLHLPVESFLVFIHHLSNRTTHNGKRTSNRRSTHAKELFFGSRDVPIIGRRVLFTATHHGRSNNHQAGNNLVNSSHRSGTLWDGKRSTKEVGRVNHEPNR